MTGDNIKAIITRLICRISKQRCSCKRTSGHLIDDYAIKIAACVKHYCNWVGSFTLCARANL